MDYIAELFWEILEFINELSLYRTIVYMLNIILLDDWVYYV